MYGAGRVKLPRLLGEVPVLDGVVPSAVSGDVVEDGMAMGRASDGVGCTAVRRGEVMGGILPPTVAVGVGGRSGERW